MATKPNYTKLITAIKDLESLLKCDICEKLAEDPYEFDVCDHLFCKSCLKRRVDNKCPICKLPVFAKDNIKSYITADIIDQINELYKILNRNSNLTIPPGSPAEVINLLSEPENIPSPNESIFDSSKISNFQTPKNIFKRNSKGETALHRAVIRGKFELVQQLLQQNFDVNEKDNAGWTPLHEAAIKGYRNIVAVLLDHGAHIDSPGGENNTPLHDAVCSNHLEVVSMLVRRGANINSINAHGLTPLDYAKTPELKAALKTPVINLNPTNIEDKNLAVNCNNLLFVTTGIKEDEMNQIQLCAELLQAKITNDIFDPNVTHLIAKCDEEPKTCKRTMKYMAAVVTGKWIVEYSWILACLDSKSHISESQFEVTGCRSKPNTFAPKKSRENSRKQLPRLFSGCYFFFHGEFENPSREDLIRLSEASGAKILKRLPTESVLTSSKVEVPYHASNNPKLRVCSHFVFFRTKLSQNIKIQNSARLKTFSVKFLFNCISKFELSGDDDDESI